jgi:hypothetical protein
MLDRGWKWVLATFAVMAALDRFMIGVLARGEPDDDETGETERATAIYGQVPEQAPPPAPSMQIGNRFVSAGPQPLGGILPAFRARQLCPRTHLET